MYTVVISFKTGSSFPNKTSSTHLVWLDLFSWVFVKDCCGKILLPLLFILIIFAGIAFAIAKACCNIA
jgi:hypothetical protein